MRVTLKNRIEEIASFGSIKSMQKDFHSQINSSKKGGFESHDRTKGFYRKTARQNGSQTDNHHLRQSFIWQLSLCCNYTLIFDPENAP